MGQAATDENRMKSLDFLVARPAPIRTDADGVARIGGTRVRLDTVITAFNAGCAAEEIVLKYPSVELSDVYAVITYYLWHRTEVDAYLDEQRRLSKDALAELEARSPSKGV